MSKNKHTPEPWRVEIGEQPECIAVLCTSGLAHFEIVSDSQLGDIHADARRIVACVNACAGFSTETLELIASVGGMQHKMTATATVASQRDKLLAALNLIEVDKDGDGFICREAMEQVREAIAHVEGADA